jgi:hypothetical protein
MPKILFNNAPTLKGANKDKTPHKLFTGTKISAEIRHHHTFGCPVYVLQNALQAGKSLPAWLLRAARVDVNLGVSRTHARSVALVLSLKTGLASPQFHVKHDNLFETTVRKVGGGYCMPRLQWQELSGFEKPSTTPVPREYTPVTKAVGKKIPAPIAVQERPTRGNRRHGLRMTLRAVGVKKTSRLM